MALVPGLGLDEQASDFVSEAKASSVETAVQNVGSMIVSYIAVRLCVMYFFLCGILVFLDPDGLP